MPFAGDFSHLYSRQTLDRKPSPLETTFHLLGDPNVVYLAGGLPLKNYFPWDSLSCNALIPPFKNGINSDLNSEEDYLEMKIMKNYRSHCSDITLARSLQYGSIEGHPELLEFLKEHTNMVHNIQYTDWGLITSIGNTYGWDAVLRVFCDEGDVVLAEEYTYPSSIACANAQGVTLFPLHTDENGIIPQRLEDLLENWSSELPMPKLLYTIPTGQNPTGTTLPIERRLEIYALAQKYDMIIVEDEPYYFLQTGAAGSNRVTTSCNKYDQFLNSLVKSFLSIDTEGRVVRLDSFSKTMAPGTRLGWISGSKKILQQFLKLHETSMHFPSGFSQTLISSTLYRWGQLGFLDWLMKLEAEYSIKRKVAIDCAKENLCKFHGFTVNTPTAGMFFTISIDASCHPEFATKFESKPENIENMLFEKLIKAGVAFAAGSWFKCNSGTEKSEICGSNIVFFRGTYSSVSLDDLVKGIRIFCAVLRHEFRVGLKTPE